MNCQTQANLRKKYICPICLWENDTRHQAMPYPAKDSNLNILESIAFCKNCNAGIAVPALSKDQLKNLYTDKGYWGNDKIKIIKSKKYPVPYTLALSRFQILEPKIKKMNKPVSIIDIGAGHGFFGLIAAKEKGIEINKYAYVEKNKILAEAFKKTWASKYSLGKLEVFSDIEQAQDEYDLMILSHTLEHQSDPREFLEIIVKKLSPQGIILIDVPNKDYLFKEDVFPHLVFFSKQSLKILLESFKLSIDSLDCYGNDMKKTPLNPKNTSKLKRMSLLIVMKLRLILPESVIVAFLNKYFEGNKKNENGIWIRAVCQKNINDQDKRGQVAENT